jgi:glycosyltransferase involved in cell wall biosynthesis
MEGLFNKFMSHLSVVIPVYNESSLIDELVKRVKKNVKLITEDFEIIIVDDGSQDNTWNMIENEAKSEKRIKAIKFSRNFGHHYAITAGLHKSDGEWVVVMDGDLQDRPEVIPDLYKKAQEGFDVVFVSRQNRPEKFYYRMAQKIFYYILRILSGIRFDSSQANFSIINKKVVLAFKEFPEKSRFYNSTILWLGFKRTNIFANHGKRYSGKPSYTLRKRTKLAADIILAFSDRPLKFAIFLGAFIFFISVLLTMYFIFIEINFGFAIQGWPSLVVLITFFGGILLFMLGVLGIYIGQIFEEVKKRPLFIIDQEINNS